MRASRAVAFSLCIIAALSLASGCGAAGPVQQGINVLWYYNGADSSAQITIKAEQSLRYVHELGANSVAINFPFYMSDPTADSVHAGNGTPSPEQLRLVVLQAKRFDLAVTLRPLLDETSFGTSAWRGTLEPSSRDEWFASYESFLGPYLAMAETAGVQTFSIGVEFTSLESDNRWFALVNQARKLYSGQLIYANNWFGLKPNAAGHAAGAQGIDAYFPVKLSDNASVAEIVAAWNHWLDSVPSSVSVNDMLLSEVGIAAQNGAYLTPYAIGDTSKPINPTIQQRWFTAACQVMRERHLPGIYYWNLAFGEVPGTFNAASAPPTSIVGRGSVAIQDCFRG